MINKKLKARIFEKFGTQADFAEVIEVNEATISRVVRGRERPSESERKRWSKALSCKPEDLFEV